MSARKRKAKYEEPEYEPKPDPKEYEAKKSKMHLTSRNPVQTEAIKSIKTKDITFLIGPAGTGKTIISVMQGLIDLSAGKYNQLIIARPVVEAGEKLGFLPGGQLEKLEPYIYPIITIIKNAIPSHVYLKCMDTNQIEIAPLAYCRGRTFSNSYVLLDEAQNASADQLKMFLTRLGDNSKMVICADPEQSDLPKSNGIELIAEKLSAIEGIGSVTFTREQIVRHRLITPILTCFEEIKNGTEHRD